MRSLGSRWRARKQRLARYELGWEPGHFYSPIPSLERVRERQAVIFGSPPASIPGIDLRADGQIELARRFEAVYPELPFGAEASGGLRYGFENPNFRHGDAIALYGMLRQHRPRRVIEVGSGYSTAAIVDVNELHLGGTVELTVIDPYPELAQRLLRPTDEVGFVRSPLEEVETGVFEALEPGDVLFVDSTHVAKVDSDVTHILFRILPALEPGVLVHFHDVYYPFEYPREWVFEGRAWNEAYVLRAFLQYNAAFEIAFFNSFLAQFHRQEIEQAMPLYAQGFGSSLWLTRMA